MSEKRRRDTQTRLQRGEVFYLSRSLEFGGMSGDRHILLPGGISFESGSKVIIYEETSWRLDAIFPGFVQEIPAGHLGHLKLSTNPNCGVSVHTWRG